MALTTALLTDGWRSSKKEKERISARLKILYNEDISAHVN
jgi:hypothetical protein